MRVRPGSKRTVTPIVEFVCIAEQLLQSHAACDGCEAIEWRWQIAARILYS
jgi:hypothetical protein